MTVTLPRINASQLTGHGATTAHTRFVIRVSGCGTGTTTNARAYFEANGTTVDYVNNALKNLETATDRATGVGFALWNESDRARIQIGQHLNHGTSWIQMTSGGVDLGYEASYIQTTATPVVAGKVRGQVQYSIEYN
jgi:type 1 fimbria pilin